MAEFQLKDLRYVQVGPTAKLAAGRGLISGIIAATILLATHRLIASGTWETIWAFISYAFSFILGVPIVHLMLAAASWILRKFNIGLGVAICGLMLTLLSLTVAAGDPFIYFLNRRFPHLFEVADFKFVNFEPTIFVLRIPGGDKDMVESAPAFNESHGATGEFDEKDSEEMEFSAPKEMPAMDETQGSIDMPRNAHAPAAESQVANRASIRPGVYISGNMKAAVVVSIVAVLAILFVGILSTRKQTQVPSQATLPVGTIGFKPFQTSLPAGPGTLNVNVRAGPSAKYPSLAVWAPGTAVTEVGRATDGQGKSWIAVQMKDGSYGFIKERLFTSPTLPASSATAISAVQQSVSRGFHLTDVSIGDQVGNGRPAADKRVFNGPNTTLGIYADYDGATQGQVMRVTVVQGVAVVVDCGDNTVQTAPAGAVWCQIKSLGAGDYHFRITAAGADLGEFPFSVTQ